MHQGTHGYTYDKEIKCYKKMKDNVLKLRSTSISPVFPRRASINPTTRRPSLLPPQLLVENLTTKSGVKKAPLFSPHSTPPTSLLVEHVSQLSEPDCKFCRKSTADPQHSDCSRMQIFTRGNRVPFLGKCQESEV